MMKTEAEIRAALRIQRRDAMRTAGIEKIDIKTMVHGAAGEAMLDCLKWVLDEPADGTFSDFEAHLRECRERDIADPWAAKKIDKMCDEFEEKQREKCNEK